PDFEQVVTFVEDEQHRAAGDESVDEVPPAGREFAQQTAAGFAVLVEDGQRLIGQSGEDAVEVSARARPAPVAGEPVPRPWAPPLAPRRRGGRCSAGSVPSRVLPAPGGRTIHERRCPGSADAYRASSASPW